MKKNVKMIYLFDYLLITSTENIKKELKYFIGLKRSIKLF